MSAFKARKKRVVQMITLAVGLPVAILYVVWVIFFESHGLQKVLLVDDGGAPHVVYTERVTAEDSDHYRITTLRVSDGERVKRSEIGDTEGEFRIYWRVYGHKAWLVEKGQPDLFDLSTHTYADVVYPKVAEGVARWPVASGALRATLSGSMTEAFIHENGDAIEAKGQEKRANFYPCWRQPEKIPLENASVRGCWGKDRAFVQHSRGPNKRDWMLRLTSPSGDYSASTWELSAKALTGNDEAWFGDALPNGDVVWVVIVEPNYLLKSFRLLKIRSFRFLEVVASDGTIVINKVL